MKEQQLKSIWCLRHMEVNGIGSASNNLRYFTTKEKAQKALKAVAETSPYCNSEKMCWDISGEYMQINYSPWAFDRWFIFEIRLD